MIFSWTVHELSLLVRVIISLTITEIICTQETGYSWNIETDGTPAFQSFDETESQISWPADQIIFMQGKVHEKSLTRIFITILNRKMIENNAVTQVLLCKRIATDKTKVQWQYCDNKMQMLPFPLIYDSYHIAFVLTEEHVLGLWADV